MLHIYLIDRLIDRQMDRQIYLVYIRSNIQKKNIAKHNINEVIFKIFSDLNYY